jgi:hypothetical protein
MPKGDLVVELQIPGVPNPLEQMLAIFNKLALSLDNHE